MLNEIGIVWKVGAVDSVILFINNYEHPFIFGFQAVRRVMWF